MPSRLTRAQVGFLLLGIIALGGALRAARWVEERGGALARAPVGDEGSYDRWGRALARGEDRGGVPYMAPLPAHVLGAAHRLLPPAAARDAYRLGAIGLGLLSIGLAFLCGRELAGEAVGLTAAFLVATHRALIYYEPTLLRDGPAAAFLALATYALLRRRRAEGRSAAGWALLAGSALGVGALIRENLFLLGALAAAALFAQGLRASASRRRAWAGAAAVALGVGAPALPWWIGNLQAEGRPAPLVTWNGGCVFYLHNRAGNLSSGYAAPPFVPAANPEGEQVGFRREAERRLGRSLTPHEISTYWLREGAREVARAPGLYGLKLLGRMRTLLVSEYGAHARDMRLDARRSHVLRIPAVGFGFLAAFALLGVVLGGPRERAVGWVVAGAILLTLPVAFLSRYRLIVVPLVAVLAAAGLARGVRGLRRLTRLAAPGWAPDRRSLAIELSRRGASAQAAVGLVIALGAGFALHQVRVDYRDTTGRANQALAWLELREPSRAVETLRACRQPDASTWALLGRAGALAGRWGVAEEGYRGLVGAAPGRIDGWLGLTVALGRQGRKREALWALAQARAIDPREPLVATLERALR